MDENARIIETSDGSHSLYLPELNESYHSSHGAITESVHVFIKNGLEYVKEKEGFKSISVFEVGFGTGLNALLAYRWAVGNRIKVSFSSIENFPVSETILKKLNYGKLIEKEEIFNTLHSAGWGESIEIDEYFTLNKIKAAWDSYSLAEDLFDVIFYDAFAPNKQPEMWGLALLTKCYKALKPGGVLVSYCAQGQFKRDLKAAGFAVETLPGPPGKKEMVRGKVKKI